MAGLVKGGSVATVSITEANVFTALGAFIVAAVADPSVEVVRGMANGVPMPAGEPIVMSPVASAPLSTTVSTFDNATQMQTYARSTQWAVQIDCYGAGANDRAQMLSMLFRSEYACLTLAASGFDMQPLYAGDPKQIPLVSGEQQYVERWSFDTVLQYNPRVSFPQESAIQLTANTPYPPGA